MLVPLILPQCGSRKDKHGPNTADYLREWVTRLTAPCTQYQIGKCTQVCDHTEYGRHLSLLSVGAERYV